MSCLAAGSRTIMTFCKIINKFNYTGIVHSQIMRNQSFDTGNVLSQLNFFSILQKAIYTRNAFHII